MKKETINPSITVCTTSDMAYDQRMLRIVTSLRKGYKVNVFHRGKSKKYVDDESYSVLPIFNKGILFYLEFNLRLILKLLFQKSDIIYAVDTDTLFACGCIKMFKKKKLIFDSHEYFIEVPELENKTFKKKVWRWIEKCFVPKASLCITVGDKLADILTEELGNKFYSIKNVPFQSDEQLKVSKEKTLIYQGAINKGRGLHCAIDAMEYLHDFTLNIVGDGDIKADLIKYAKTKPFNENIHFIEKTTPIHLKLLTQNAKFGLNLLDNVSKNYYYSLANKFFDYLQAEIPSINMDFPEYRNIIDQYQVGIMISNLDPKVLAQEIKANEVPEAYDLLMQNCKRFKSIYTWEKEEEKLMQLVKTHF